MLVINGMIEEAPWRALLPFADIVNIDLKGFTDTWYRKLGNKSDVAQIPVKNIIYKKVLDKNNAK